MALDEITVELDETQTATLQYDELETYLNDRWKVALAAWMISDCLPARD